MKYQADGEGLEVRSARGRPLLEDVAQIEERLLEVALQEFLDKGYGGASLSQIVKSAAISKTTLYSRYGSKEALFRAIMHRQVERLGAVATLTSSLPMDLSRGLMAYANRTLAISLEGDLLAVNRLIYGEAHRFPELASAAAERTQVGIGQIAWFIQQCAHASGRHCADPQSAAEAFILLLRGWHANAMLADRVISSGEREAWVERIVPAFVAGCAV